jgi:type I restriction enzyme, S subunit
VSNNWQMIRLGQILEPSKRRAVGLETHTLPPVLSITRAHGLVLQSSKFLKEVASKDRSQYKLVEKNGVVCGFPIDEGVIGVLLDRPTGLVSPAYQVYTLTADVEPEYLHLILRYPGTLQRFASLATNVVERRRSVSVRDFLSVEIPVPTKNEQRAIAAVLRATQDVPSRLAAKLDAANVLRKSLESSLLSSQLSRTDVARMTIGSFAKVGNGSTPKKDRLEYWDTPDVPWLTSSKVHDRIIVSADQYVSKVAKEECHLPLVPAESLVMAITGQGKTLGNAALLRLPTTVNQHLAYITITDSKVRPLYLLAFLRSRYLEFQSLGKGGGSTKGALTCGLIKNYEVPVPCLQEQEKIISIFESVEEMLAKVKDEIETAERLFSSALQHLLIGKVPVPEFANGELHGVGA